MPRAATRDPRTTPVVALRAMLARLPDDLASLREACAAVGDWRALLDAARRHGVDGVVVGAARRIGFAAADPAWTEANERLRRSLVWRDVLDDALTAVLGALAARAVPVVALKGPVLASRLYDEPALRPSTDLDLLVHPEAIDAAAGALAPLGYVLEGGADGRFFRRHHHHVHLGHPTLPGVELHFEAYRGFGTALPAAPLLARSRAYDGPRWRGARVLSPEDEFLYLAVHAASHRLTRLIWIYDLKLLSRRHPELSWSELAERARALGLSAVASFACARLADWLQTPRYGEEHWAGLGAARRALAERLIDAPEGHLANAAADFLFGALLCEDAARAGAYAGRFVRVKVLHEAPRRARAVFAG